MTAIDAKTRKISLSIKQREIAEEKEAVAEYGSSESGASLGDILGAAFTKAAAERKPEAEAKDADEDEAKAKPKKAAKKAAPKKKKAAASDDDADDGAADGEAGGDDAAEEKSDAADGESAEEK